MRVDNEACNESPRQSIHLAREEIHPSAASDLQVYSFTRRCGARRLMPDLMAHGQACGNKEGPSVNPIRQCVLRNMWTMKNEPAPQAGITPGLKKGGGGWREEEERSRQITSLSLPAGFGWVALSAIEWLIRWEGRVWRGLQRRETWRLAFQR